MKQALLITAYRNFDHLIDLINFFDDSFEAYIHIDRKTTVAPEILKQIQSLQSVKFVSQKYKVNWAGFNHVKACLLLAEEALKNPEITYFHLISGQDFPTKNISDFKQLAEHTEKRDYMTHFKMPSKVWENGGMDRLEYYQCYDLFDGKKDKAWIQRLLNLQKALHYKRPLSKKIPALYGGDNWWTLSRNTLQYVVTYTKTHKHFMRRMEHTFAIDEIFFQTIILNSPYASNVVNDNLRYIDWNSGRNASPSSPATIDLTDLEKINSSPALFARKFESPISDALKKALQKNKTV